MEYEYKVIDVADGSISSVLLGEGRVETAVLQAYLNAMAAEGWRLVFMEKVMQRHLVRGGSACLNSFEPFLKWISCSATPRPGLVAA
jgi:hypothetical protein